MLQRERCKIKQRAQHDMRAKMTVFETINQTLQLESRARNFLYVCYVRGAVYCLHTSLLLARESPFPVSETPCGTKICPSLVLLTLSRGAPRLGSCPARQNRTVTFLFLFLTQIFDCLDSFGMSFSLSWLDFCLAHSGQASSCFCMDSFEDR